MTRAQLQQKARRLREKGLTLKEISERLGIAKTRTWRLLNPERSIAVERERLVEKREWQRGHRLLCPKCGEPMGAGSASPSRTPKRCRRCQFAEQHAALLERDRELERLWADGAKSSEIMAHFGWSKGHLAVGMFRARERGARLPYRHDYGDRHDRPELRKAA